AGFLADARSVAETLIGTLIADFVLVAILLAIAVALAHALAGVLEVFELGVQFVGHLLGHLHVGELIGGVGQRGRGGLGFLRAFLSLTLVLAGALALLGGLGHFLGEFLELLLGFLVLADFLGQVLHLLLRHALLAQPLLQLLFELLGIHFVQF